MKLPDFWTGLAVVAIGLFVVFQTLGFPDVAGGASPRLFPQIIGGLLVVLGGSITARTLVRDGFRPGWDRPEWLADPRRIARILYIPVAIAVFALAAPSVGTVLVSAVLLFGFSLLWETRWLPALIFAVAFSIALYLFFTEVMRVPLPAGRLLSIF
ncbi:MAG: tripartite tricarboxylate transporter TctB family protein [Paracoccus sp. (in: a-proteobacteria)]